MYLILWDFFLKLMNVSETGGLLLMSMDKVGKEMNEIRDFNSKVKGHMKT